MIENIDPDVSDIAFDYILTSIFIISVFDIAFVIYIVRRWWIWIFI